MMEFCAYRNIKRTAKEHRCVCCGAVVETGSSALYFAQKWDGYFFHGYMHHDCRDCEIRLNDLAETYADEWINLSDRDSEDDAWIANDFPVVAKRLGIGVRS